MNRIDAFLLLCDCISPCNRSRDQIEITRDRLLSGVVHWESLVEAANHHILCPTLYGALKHKQLLDCIPSELADYLETLHRHNEERNRDLAAHAQETIQYLNELGVEPVLLKGTANLLTDLYFDRGMRFIGDIDLLIPADRMMDCVRKLQAADYHYLSSPEIYEQTNHFHCPPLLKKNAYFRIELHRELVHEPHRSLIDAKSMLSDSTPHQIGPAAARIPSLRHRIIHNVVHTQITDQSYCYGSIRLRQLHDLVLLAEKAPAGEDWESIASHFSRCGYSNALAGYFLAGKRFFGLFQPREIRETVAARAYLAGLCSQENQLWFMRLGNLARVAILYYNRFRRLLACRRMPRVWEREIWRSHGSQMASMMRKSW